jgi:transposase
VYYGGAAWTGRHDLWLRHDTLQLTGRASRATSDSDYETVFATKARRDRLQALC